MRDSSAHRLAAPHPSDPWPTPAPDLARLGVWAGPDTSHHPQSYPLLILDEWLGFGLGLPWPGPSENEVSEQLSPRLQPRPALQFTSVPLPPGEFKVKLNCLLPWPRRASCLLRSGHLDCPPVPLLGLQIPASALLGVKAWGHQGEKGRGLHPPLPPLSTPAFYLFIAPSACTPVSSGV